MFDSENATPPGDIFQIDGIGTRTGMSIDAKSNQIVYFAPRGEVTPYLYDTIDADFDGDDVEDTTLVVMNRVDADGTVYYADISGETPVFYKSSESGLVETNDDDVTFNPKVSPGSLLTDADGITFYTEDMLAEVAYFALDGEEYTYSNDEKRFVISKRSDASFPAETGLNGHSYSEYGITLQPVYEFLSNDTYEITFFMKFNDIIHENGDPPLPEETAQANANRYFLDYFEANDGEKKQSIIDNFEDYANIVSFVKDDENTEEDEDDGSKISTRTLGNIFSKDGDNYGVKSALAAAFESIRSEARIIKGIFDQYCISLSPQADVETTNTADNPYNYYIDEEKLFNDIPSDNSQLRFYTGDRFSAVIYRGDKYVYNYGADYYDGSDNSKLSIIIATGDVEVNGTFFGLIIAGGDIYLKENCILNRFAEGVAGAYNSDTIRAEHIHDSSVDVDGVHDRLLKDYFKMDISKEFLYSSSRSGDAWNVDDLVSYKNWHR